MKGSLLTTALVTVTHDPEGRNIKIFKELQYTLEAIYSKLFITISEESSLDLIKEIEKSKFKYKIIPKNGAAYARREALKFALTGESQHYHYCDFDRLLTWGKNYITELKEVVEDIPNHDYLIIGRTERAMNTHPIEWIETEKITNRIFSIELGKDADVTAGSCAFSRISADFINQYSKEKMTDAEWAMIALRIAKRQVAYCAVEGLEYQEEINGLNRNVSESERWYSRLNLSLIISQTAMKVGK
ncbi:hypothetical protein PB01_18550 [Psychrobacillus glaciei]|uniref:Glycosyltransferase n=1 Tax=Psychrobacillus glaciei TaxID=2283160 RepID=A0A5J6SST4_9BACI|nr:hypothetical protein [Psychrobacillus glaciei]QFG00630.1 hypothetical protein PB01_18550 [Psychrobacillus glaciei]